MIAQRQDVFVQIGVVGDEHAALSGGDRLGAVERERPEQSHRAGLAVVIDGPDRLGGVFDDRYSMARTDCEEFVHVAEVAVEMHRDDALGLWRDCLFHQDRIEAPAVFENVDEDRGGPEMDYWCDGGDPIGVCHDHLVTGHDAHRSQPEMDRARATRRRDRVGHVDVLAEGAFEPIDVAITVLTPAVSRSIGRIANFKVGDRRLGVIDPGLH